METFSGNAFPVFARGLLQTGELAGGIRRCVAENRVGGPTSRDVLGFVPIGAEVVEPVRVADLLEALSAGRGPTAGDGGAGIRETGPGAEIAIFFAIHKALFASIDAERGRGSLQTGQLAAVTSIDRCQRAAFRRLFAPSPNFSVAREGRRDGVGRGWK